MIDDPDERLLGWLYNHCQCCSELEPSIPQLFEQIAAFFDRWPAQPKKLSGLVWDWLELSASHETLAGILYRYLGKRSPKLMIPYLPIVNPTTASIASELGKIRPVDPEVQQVLLKLMVMPVVMYGNKFWTFSKKLPIDSLAAEHFIKLLTRKSSELRQGLLSLLLSIWWRHALVRPRAY